MISKSNNHEAIAIIGIGCRFPGGVNTPAAFWELIKNGNIAITDIPADRWNSTKFYDPDIEKHGKMYVKTGGFLKEKIDHFDASFFEISPREAGCIDPQQRLLLEVSWEALEDAGIDTADITGSNTGVFIGAFTLDNMLNQMSALNRKNIGNHTAISSTMTILSNRISYFFDLKGPSVTLDTACSSSLVSLHYACRAIWHGDCKMALTGGVNIILRPEYSIAMCKSRFLAPDGFSKSFDERANGYARGEGAGIIVLKPLSEALKDNNLIYALIRGTGVNQDGRTRSITVPNPDSQKELIQKVLTDSKLSPDQIGYVEAHGTGTATGDPIEAESIGAVIGKNRDKEDGCFIGSVKANIGHLEAASGIAGIIKSTLCLQNMEIPPLANLKTPNPKIPFKELGLKLPTACAPMPVNNEGKAFVGINSFGYGGTNAHVILESYKVPEIKKATTKPDNERTCIFTLSARNKKALKELTQRYINFISHNPSISLKNICYSTAVHRTHHNFRLSVAVSTTSQLIKELQIYLKDENSSSVISGNFAYNKQVKPVFVFTGMGPQWWGMGRELLKKEPVFLNMARRCDGIFKKYAGWSILEEMLKDKEAFRIERIEVTQPANFLLQVSLLELYKSWGIEPVAIVGHSAGEMAAAFTAGALSLEDAILVTYHRSRIQKKVTGKGGMLAAEISEDTARSLAVCFDNKISIAAINSSSAVTLSGDMDILNEISILLNEKNIYNKFLQVEIPFHSHYMELLKDEILSSLKSINPQKPNVPVYSTVSGGIVSGNSFNAEYWYQNIRKSVYFAKAINMIVKDNHTFFLEIGPHPVLSTSIKECLEKAGVEGITLFSLHRRKPEQKTILNMICKLYTKGCKIDWKGYYTDGTFIRLPHYPWQYQKYWHEAELSIKDRVYIQEHPLLGDQIVCPSPVWKNILGDQPLNYLNDHVVDGITVLPAAAYIEMALSVNKVLTGNERCVLEDINFKHAFIINDNDESVLYTTYDEETREYKIFSTTGKYKKSWVCHSNGKINTYIKQDTLMTEWEYCNYNPFVKKSEEIIEKIYNHFNNSGLQYGRCFRNIKKIWKNNNEVLAYIKGNSSLNTENSGYLIHPTVLDSCFQALLFSNIENGESRTYIPIHTQKIVLHKKHSGPFYCHGKLILSVKNYIVGDMILMNEAGNIFAEIHGFVCQDITDNDKERVNILKNWLYEYSWEEQAVSQPGTIQQQEKWLVFSADDEFSDNFLHKLKSTGINDVVSVKQGEHYLKENDFSYKIRNRSTRDITQLIQEIDIEKLGNIIYLWNYGNSGDSEAIDGIDACLICFHLFKTLFQLHYSHPPKIHVLTKGAQFINQSTCNIISIEQTALTGFVRAVISEYPEYQCSLIDIDPMSPDESIPMIIDELLLNTKEDDVAFRSGRRFIHRVIRKVTVDSSREDNPYDKYDNLQDTIKQIQTRCNDTLFSPEASYLITGAFGGFGLEIVKWIVKNGARNLILAGRRGAVSEKAKEMIETLKEKSINYVVSKVDITQGKSVQKLITNIKTIMPPLKGIMHLAAVLNDDLIINLDEDGFRTVLQPKIIGAVNLHNTTKHLPLDFFILFSSISSLIGNARQSNYVTANTFLDSFAHYRTLQGLPATTINWGAMATVGMTEDTKVEEHLERMGLSKMPVKKALFALKQAIHWNSVQLGIMDFNWGKWKNYDPFSSSSPRFTYLVPDTIADNNLKRENENSIRAYLEGLDQKEREKMIELILVELFSGVLHMPAENIDGRMSLINMGIDSLLASELKQIIKLKFQIEISAFELLKGINIKQLSRSIMDRMVINV